MRSEKVHEVQQSDHKATLGWLICIFTTLGLVIYSFYPESTGISPFNIFIKEDAYVHQDYTNQEVLIDIADAKFDMSASYTMDFPDRVYQRDDDSSSTETSESKPKSQVQKIFDSTAIRVVLVLFGFVFLNMIAICIHHVYQKLTSNEKSYRTIQHEISPF